MDKLKKQLYILWALNVFDVFITWIVLSFGGIESNPIMGLLGGSMILTVIYKVVVLLIISFFTIRGYKDSENFGINVVRVLNVCFGIIGIVNIYNFFILYGK